MIKHLLCVAACVTVAATVSAQTNLIKVDTSATRTKDARNALLDSTVRTFARSYQGLTQAARTHRDAIAGRGSVAMLVPPVRVDVTPKSTSRITQTSGDINLVFDGTGTRAFPSDYQTFLQTIFANAKATMNLVFGAPALGGDVHVLNYDSDIGDRDAVSGGYYVPDNGSGAREIRFPVYQSGEAAAINFIHTILLAYQGTTPYTYDAFEEGLVRAAAMKIVRTPAAVPTLDQTLVGYVLQSSYDVGAYYDWYNQRALGGAKFIAPNLRDVPLPSGSSIGGIYLLRYMMSGSAWQKVLAEYPTFIATFNTAVYGNPTLASNVSGLVTLGQQVLTSLRPADPTIEGRSFSDWFQHQYILETTNTAGLKLLVAPQPITSGLSGTDFGVFDVQVTYFQSLSGGNELLLRGTSYPIFWDPSYNRLFPDSQSERMDIVASYGSVAPNFPDQNAGDAYRVTIDIPVQDQVARANIPAGSIATASSASISDFFGTLEGVVASTTTTYSVRASIGGTTIATVPVVNGAFGTTIGSTTWLAQRSVLVEVLSTTSGVTQTVYSRIVNKAPGALAVDLSVGGEGTVTISGGLPGGISTLGFSVDPFSSSAPAVLGQPATNFLLARWNGATSKYDLYPDTEPFKIGNGYFVRVPATQALQISGYVTPPNVVQSVALRPGWNLIANPLQSTVATSNVLVVSSTGFPITYAEALGTELGTDFYDFSPGDNDSASGVPETGSYVAGTGFASGHGYFVRCLDSNGATLVFFPTSTAAATRAKPSSFAATTTTPVWRLKTVATMGSKSTANVIGMVQGATKSFDAAIDSALPPSIGGFQVAAIDGDSYYKDFHAISTSDAFTLKLTGLRVGSTVSVAFTEDIKRAKSLSYSRDGGTTIKFSGVGRLSFVAKSTTSTITIKVTR